MGTHFCIDYFLRPYVANSSRSFRFFRTSLVFLVQPTSNKTHASFFSLFRQAAQQALSGQSNNVSATLANGSTLSSAEDARRRQHQQDQTTAAATARQNHQQQHSYDCDSTSSTMTTMANTTTVAPNSDLFLLGAAFQQQSQIQHQLLHQQSSYLQQQQVGLRNFLVFRPCFSSLVFVTDLIRKWGFMSAVGKEYFVNSSYVYYLQARHFSP